MAIRESFMKFKQRSKGGYVYLVEERCKQKGGVGVGTAGQ